MKNTLRTRNCLENSCYQRHKFQQLSTEAIKYAKLRLDVTNRFSVIQNYQ